MDLQARPLSTVRDRVGEADKWTLDIPSATDAAAIQRSLFPLYVSKGQLFGFFLLQLRWTVAVIKEIRLIVKGFCGLSCPRGRVGRFCGALGSCFLILLLFNNQPIYG